MDDVRLTAVKERTNQMTRWMSRGGLTLGLIAVAMATGCSAKVSARVESPKPAAAEPAPPPPMQGDKIVLPGELEFDTGKATIKDSDTSRQILGALVDVMKKHPEITKLRIEGHTDDRGGKTFNQKLSTSRAETVAERLVKEGVEKERLSTIGLGQTKPLADNATVENRRANRRTEFHVEEMNGKPADSAATTRTSAVNANTTTTSAQTTAKPATTTTTKTEGNPKTSNAGAKAAPAKS